VQTLGADSTIPQSIAKFSAVGKECTRQEESRVRAKDPKERIDTFMKKASRMKSAVMG
jgi:hypothetical protein